MCGLVGFINYIDNSQINSQILKLMADKINHRGPDDRGQIIIEDLVYLAHLRLSILDVSKNGSQPMQSFSARYVIAFNGEIYNHNQIREELNKYLTIQWKSTSDTETLLEAFEFFGIQETLDRLSGMFAISLIDKKNEKLYLIRDRTGEKPLYYGFDRSNFFFSSELKALKENKKINFKLNELALAKYFKFGYVPSPLSIYQNVFKLEPGSFLELNYKNRDFSTYNIKKYWDINNFNKINTLQNYDTIKSKCENLIVNSIEEQLLSDVPLGAFLSSGIDSSLIVSLMSKLMPGNVETFSIGFKEKAYNEAHNAKKIAKYLGTSHNELYLDSKIVLNQVSQIAEIYDEPFADSSQIPTFLVSKFARTKVTVSLSGDGGDEMFAGYNRYLNSQKILKFNNLIPSSIKNILKFFLTRLSPNQWNKLFYVLNKLYLLPRVSLAGDKIYKLIDLIYKNDISNLYDYYVTFWKRNENIFFNQSNNYILDDYYLFESEDNFISEMMVLDAQSYLPDDILVKVDRASMANSLESRAPFLNKDIIEYAHTIDSSLKYNKKNKVILRDILSKYLPKKLFDLPKSGFGIPIDLWLRQDLKDWAFSLIELNKVSNNNYFNNDYIDMIFNEHIKGKRNWSNKLWSFLMFQLWVNKFEK